MNNELISLVKQLHLGQLSQGKIVPCEGLDCKSYLLEVLRAELSGRKKEPKQSE